MSKFIALITASLVWGNLAFGATFLGSVKEGFTPIGLAELEAKISEHAKNKKTYLSVGESHLEAASAGLLNFNLIETYAKSSKAKTVFCSESIGHFLDVFQAPIETMTDKSKIFLKNGPYKTDFENCKGGGQNYITYSGFFHQYPFAREFPREFAPVPVITDKGNNIKEQMNRLKGLFVTQMEMEYMEFSATKAILAAKPSAEILVSETAKLAKKVDAIWAAMEPLLETGNKYTSKDGVIVSGEDFDVSLHGENNFFLFTNLRYRNDLGSLKALKALASLPEEKLETFLESSREGIFYISALFVGPDSNGGMGQILYPHVSKKFEGGTFFIQHKTQSSNKLYAFERTGDSFECFDVDKDSEVACF